MIEIIFFLVMIAYMITAENRDRDQNKEIARLRDEIKELKRMRGD